jgi:hypothetical protein
VESTQVLEMKTANENLDPEEEEKEKLGEIEMAYR